MRRDDLIHIRDTQTQEAAQRLGYAVDLTRTGLNALLLVNGGALVALFAVLGEEDVEQHRLWAAFACFAAAIGSALGAWMLAFLSQNILAIASQQTAWEAAARMAGGRIESDPEPQTRRGNRAMAGAVWLACLSLSGFVAGAGCALWAVLP